MAPVYYGIQRVDLPLDDNGEILGYIPQVEQTYTYFQSAYSHINEYQLCIGESTTSQRPELQVNKGEGKQIMTVEQAMIFALQRCKTAEEALTLITSLMEKYGSSPLAGRNQNVSRLRTRKEYGFSNFSVSVKTGPRKVVSRV